MDVLNEMPGVFSRMYDACSVADERDAGEGFLEVEGPLGVIMGQSVEFFLVTLHLLDKVDKVTRLLELFQILSINHVTKFVLNPDNQLDDIK